MSVLPEDGIVRLLITRDGGSFFTDLLISDYFLAFGHGRHACLGRSFASIMIKLTVSYVIGVETGIS